MEDKAVIKVVWISKIKGKNDKSDSFLSEILGYTLHLRCLFE